MMTKYKELCDRYYEGMNVNCLDNNYKLKVLSYNYFA